MQITCIPSVWFHIDLVCVCLLCTLFCICLCGWSHSKALEPTGTSSTSKEPIWFLFSVGSSVSGLRLFLSFNFFHLSFSSLNCLSNPLLLLFKKKAIYRPCNIQLQSIFLLSFDRLYLFPLIGYSLVETYKTPSLIVSTISIHTRTNAFTLRLSSFRISLLFRSVNSLTTLVLFFLTHQPVSISSKKKNVYHQGKSCKV